MQHDDEFAFDVTILEGGLNFGGSSLEVFFVFFREFASDKNSSVWAEVLLDFAH